MSRIVDHTEPSGSHSKLVTSILSQVGYDSDPRLKSEKIASGFADPYAHLWPIDSPLSLIKSAASIAIQADQMTPERHKRVSDALYKAAGMMGLEGPVAVIRSHVRAKLRGSVKSASATIYALPEIQRLPVSTADQTAASVAHFLKNRQNFSHGLRQKAAAALLDAADEQSVNIDASKRDKLEASAGRGIGHPAKLARAMADRAYRVIARCTRDGVSLYKAASVIARMNGDMAHLKQVATKAAAAMDLVDEKYDLRRHYGISLEFPDDAAFCTVYTKAASAASKLISINGCAYWKEDIARIPAENFDILDPEMPAKVASQDGRTSPEALAKFAGRGLARVLRGFGIQSADAAMMPRRLGSVSGFSDPGLEADANGWARIAAKYGGQPLQVGSGIAFSIA